MAWASETDGEGQKVRTAPWNLKLFGHSIEVASQDLCGQVYQGTHITFFVVGVGFFTCLSTGFIWLPSIRLAPRARVNSRWPFLPPPPFLYRRDWQRVCALTVASISMAVKPVIPTLTAFLLLVAMMR